MAHTYKAAKGATYKDRDAQIIGERLETLGVVKPEDIVRDAARKRSPLHPYFEWDDGLAADEYRKQQARYLVRHLQVVIKVEGGVETTKAYHSLRITKDDNEPGEQAYVPLNIIRADAALTDQVIQKALNELISWTARYEKYKAILPGVFSAIAEAATDLEPAAA